MSIGVALQQRRSLGVQLGVARASALEPCIAYVRRLFERPMKDLLDPLPAMTLRRQLRSDSFSPRHFPVQPRFGKALLAYYGGGRNAEGLRRFL